MNRLSNAERAKIIRALVEGNSLRSVTRLTGRSINTVTKLLVDLGEACGDYQDRIFRNLTDVLDGDSKKDDLLQVTDLLTGCVYGSLRDTRQGRRRAIVDTFLRGCGVDSVRSQPTKVRKGKVRLLDLEGKQNEPSDALDPHRSAPCRQLDDSDADGSR